jgi:tRNA(fMet)-specific endonuclease VapC
VRFLLDTDICIYALKRDPAVLENLLAHSRADVALSVISEAELRTGAAKSSSPSKTLQRIAAFLRPLTLVEYTSADAMAYAHIRARLERAGTPIGPLDTLIAAQAVARKFVLVTNNQREFSRVADLKLENWARPTR